jgi:hypothetical protein
MTEHLLEFPQNFSNQTIQKRGYMCRGLRFFFWWYAVTDYVLLKDRECNVTVRKKWYYKSAII